MGADVRKKALQRFEVVFKAQVDAWQHLLAEAAARAASIEPLDAARHGADLIVGAASGMAKQRLRGWASGPIEDIAGAGEPDLMERPGGAMSPSRSWSLVDGARRASRSPLGVSAQERTPLTLRGVPAGDRAAGRRWR